MSERTNHLFKFPASQIAEAAAAEAAHHERRVRWWQEQLKIASDRVRSQAKIEFRELAISGGSRLDVVVNYGDPAAHARMQEAWSKVQDHRRAAETFRVEQKLYESQGDHPYSLDASDVDHFRIGAPERDE